MDDHNSIENNSKVIRLLLTEKGLRASDLAEGMGKSRQLISSLINPDQIRGKQIECIEFLKNYTPEK